MKKFFSILIPIIFSWIVIIISPFLFSGNLINSKTNPQSLNIKDDSLLSNVYFHDDLLNLQPENLDSASKASSSIPTTFYLDLNSLEWMDIENDGTNQADLSFNFYLESDDSLGYQNQNLYFYFEQITGSDFFAATGYYIDGVEVLFSLTEDDIVDSEISLVSNLFNYSLVEEGTPVSYTNPYQYDDLYVSFVVAVNDTPIAKINNPLWTATEEYYVFTNHISLDSDINSEDNKHLVSGYYQKDNEKYQDTSIINNYSFVPNYDLYPITSTINGTGMILDFVNFYYYLGDVTIEYYDGDSESYKSEVLENPYLLTWNERAFSTVEQSIENVETIQIEDGMFNVQTSTDLANYGPSDYYNNVMLIDSQVFKANPSLWFSNAFSKLTLLNSDLSKDQKYGNWGQNPAYSNDDIANNYLVEGFYTFNFADSDLSSTSNNYEYYNEAFIEPSTVSSLNFNYLIKLGSSITYQTYYDSDLANTTSSTVVPYYQDIGYSIDATFDPTGTPVTSTGLFWYWWLLISIAILVIVTTIIAVPLIITRSKKQFL